MDDETLDVGAQQSNGGLWAAFGVVALLLIGAVGHVSGVGWFGYRAILYGRGELYLLNRGAEPARVSVDGRPEVTVDPDHYEIVELVGGSNPVVVEQGGEETTYTIETDHSDAFLRVSHEECLVATDVTPFYGPSDSPDELEIVERIRRGRHVYVPGSYNVFWPRRSFPDQLSGSGGPAIWIETLGCDLFGQPKYLQTYLMVRLRDRLGLDTPSRRKRP